ncbi:MAG: hemerythrin domain-containing protein, partial [Acidobacteriaceae bacterium]|nr:hemerythrin domain-containing protein [Acidobacteriaceae bacterium]
DDSGELLRAIRKVANDFQPPNGACTTYRALFAGLKQHEEDLHRHIHLENNILFPRALEMARSKVDTVAQDAK